MVLLRSNYTASYWIKSDEAAGAAEWGEEGEAGWGSAEGGEWRKPNKFPLVESPSLPGLGLRMNEREAQRANK